jgi:DNA invertase Pin-like site-specific DNA recombinase
VPWCGDAGWAILDAVTGQAIGYARCFDRDDSRGQRAVLESMGVAAEDVYVDTGYLGRGPRPGLDQALGACGPGDLLVIASLDRLARSMRDLQPIIQLLSDNGSRLAFDGLVFDMATPAGQLLVTLSARFADFEGNVISARTRVGLKNARRSGRPTGRPPTLSRESSRQLLEDFDSGDFSITELMIRYPLKRAALYATIRREREFRDEE